MNKTKHAGIALVLLGVLVLVPAFLRAYTDQSACSMIAGSPGIRCAEPSSVSATVFFAAVAGSALVTTGVWKTGFGGGRVAKDGSVLIFSTGLIIIGLGLFASMFLPYTFTSSALIGYFLGLIGAALMMGGLVKNAVGRTNAVS